MPRFVEKFARFTTEELLVITLSPEDYQTEAIQDAENILESRDVDPGLRDAIKTKLDAEKNQKQEAEDTRKIANLNILRSITEAISPVSNKKVQAHQLIRGLSAVWIALSLYSIYKQKDLLLTLWNEYEFFTSYGLFVLLSGLTSLLGAIWLLKYKTKGWILLCFNIIFVFVLTLLNSYTFYRISSEYYTYDIQLDNSTVLLKNLFSGIFLTGNLFILFQKRVLVLCRVRKKIWLGTIIFSLVFSFLLLKFLKNLI